VNAARGPSGLIDVRSHLSNREFETAVIPVLTWEWPDVRWGDLGYVGQWKRPAGLLTRADVEVKRFETLASSVRERVELVGRPAIMTEREG
jgi:hypothetical protein